MISNWDFKGYSAFKIACRIILQLNVRVRFKVGFYSHKNTIYCAILSEKIGWLPIGCAYFILFDRHAPDF